MVDSMDIRKEEATLARKKRSTGRRVTIAVIAGLLALILLPNIIVPIYNDIVAARYLQQLKDYPLPDDAARAGAFWEVGKFTGNGNNTEYFAAIILETALSQEEIAAYYQVAGFSPARPRHQAHQLHVGVIEDGRLIFEDDFHFSKPLDLPEGGRYICVALYDGGYPAMFDIRGH